MQADDVDVAFNLEINRRHAKWTALRMQLRHPEDAWCLYARGHEHYLVAKCDQAKAVALAAELDDIRPMSCHIEFAIEAPAQAEVVDTGVALSDELWMSHEPLRLIDIQRSLCLAIPNLPVGELTLDEHKRQWNFSSTAPLSSEEQDRVLQGFRRLGQPGTLVFVQAAPSAPAPPDPHRAPMAPKQGPDLELISSRESAAHPVREIVEKDESVWREFLKRREARAFEIRSPEPKELACTWAGEDESDVRLGELLTLYDRVDFIAPIMGNAEGGILGRLGLSEPEFQELVSLRKLRLIVPRPVVQYEGRVLQMAAEADPQSLVLSRALAAAVLEQGQRKDPLLYGPFSSAERAGLMAALTKLAPPDHPLRSVLASYSKAFENQNLFFMERGAMACLTHGVGPHMANILEARTGADRRLELMTTGAQVEWSLGLGAAYLPPVIGGFSTDAFASFVASYYGRIGQAVQTRADAVANRIHTVVQSLLVPSEVGPLEVVRNLQGGSLQRFRSVARKLMTHAADQAELEAAVNQVNEDIRSYERRIERVRKYGIGALLVTTGHHALTHEMHEAIGFGGSVFAMWLAEMIYERAREHTRLLEHVDSIADTLRGLILSPSLDAVIIRQVRDDLAK